MRYTQEVLAPTVGKEKQSIQWPEDGHVNPSFLVISNIAKGIGINLDDLFIVLSLLVKNSTQMPFHLRKEVQYLF